MANDHPDFPMPDAGTFHDDPDVEPECPACGSAPGHEPDTLAPGQYWCPRPIDECRVRTFHALPGREGDDG